MKDIVWEIPDLGRYVPQSGRLEEEAVYLFREEIWHFYGKHGRSFAWRDAQDPYHVFISEVMLQQTQTHRVVDKFVAFLQAFPSFQHLAAAPLRDVLVLWQGLGYNRRARALHESARLVVAQHGGVLPTEEILLDALPGIGPATAASIAAFAFQKPTVFIETNIRAVFIALFFSALQQVPDKNLFPLVAQTIDVDDPRHWYYALMDYGVMLKKRFSNPSRQSKHYTQQSCFEGSERQIRGMIIRYLTTHATATKQELFAAINRPVERIERNLNALCAEQLVREKAERYFL